ncbi:uncharacterized protein LOC126278864 [Schistocerca gregaria]|uniref:uncharacterized protein LOC126278864 n=1 Tax=Schistocerca gregaria TaxID=7010 RepID=UPI00211EC833|nr:uncharacterized protein LOC126278864 [Schistocerca gregaria]
MFSSRWARASLSNTVATPGLAPGCTTMAVGCWLGCRPATIACSGLAVVFTTGAAAPLLIAPPPAAAAPPPAAAALTLTSTSAVGVWLASRSGAGDPTAAAATAAALPLEAADAAPGAAPDVAPPPPPPLLVLLRLWREPRVLRRCSRGGGAASDTSSPVPVPPRGGTCGQSGEHTSSPISSPWLARHGASVAWERSAGSGKLQAAVTQLKEAAANTSQ